MLSWSIITVIEALNICTVRHDTEERIEARHQNEKDYCEANAEERLGTQWKHNCQHSFERETGQRVLHKVYLRMECGKMCLPEYST